MQDYIKGALLGSNTLYRYWAKKQTRLAWFETLAKASSPAQVQLDKNLSFFSFLWSYLHQHWGCPRGKAGGFWPHTSLLWIFCFYKYVQINYRHFEMSLVGINQHCKVMDSQSVKKTQAGFSRQWFRSLSGEGERGLLCF